MANTEGLQQTGSMHRATCCIFEKLRDLPDYSNAKIALISGFANDDYPHSERAEVRNSLEPNVWSNIAHEE